MNATNQSKHVRSDLKKRIIESVRNIFNALKKDIVDKSAKNFMKHFISISSADY
jgi:CHASE3 domain sensor protein